MSRYPDLPQVQAASQGGLRSVTQTVIIHATDNTATAEQEGSYAARRTDQVSAHFYVDNDSAVQAVDTAYVAYGVGPTGNSRSVQFELCGLSNQISDATMRYAAPLVARVCQEFAVPVRKITAADLLAGVRGICGHLDITNAWHESTHTDPGASFPWATFISYVQNAEADMGLTAQEFDLIVRGSITLDNALFYWLRRIAEGRNPLTGGLEGIGMPQLNAKLDQLLTRAVAVAEQDQARDDALRAAFNAIAAGGRGVDTDAVIEAVRQVQAGVGEQLAGLRERAE